jgi:hypothetical protein
VHEGAGASTTKRESHCASSELASETLQVVSVVAPEMVVPGGLDVIEPGGRTLRQAIGPLQ